MDKRAFLKGLALTCFTPGALFAKMEDLNKTYDSWSPGALAKEEDFWREIRRGYRLKPDYINLESGYYCFMPQEILEKYIEHIREINYQNSYYLRTVQFPNKWQVHKRLAGLADCSEEELILTRNTTESLDTIIGGFPWKKGDEAVMALQDYGAMLDMFELVSQRYGVVNKKVNIPNHPQSDEEIVSLYEKAITAKTRLLMVCHIVNITGQVLPIKKIVEMAHRKGVEVMVDGAHAFAHIRFSVKDLGCDYYGASLHKWLSAPLGAGILYVKKEKVPQLWPLFAEMWRKKEDIRRLNHTGTHPVATDLAIHNAIDYYEFLGAERKEKRLKYLQHYWTSQVRDWDHIEVNTPADDQRHGAIANVAVKGMKPRELSKTLLDKYRIWTVAIDRPGVKGVRITPNVYTKTQELDALIDALEDLKKQAQN